MKYFNKTNLLPGNMFVVKPNDVKEMSFSNGSKGYFSYILGSNDYNHNIIYNNIILTKRGFKGKDRLITSTMITPLYICENEEINNLLFTNEYQYTPVTSYPTNVLNIDTFTSIDFCGWLLAILQLHKKLDTVNNTILLNELNNTNYYEKQLFIFEYNNLLIQFYNNIENSYNDGVNDFCTQAARNILIKELRNQNNLFILPYHNYLLNILTIEYNALEYIKSNITKSTIKNKQLYIDELKELQKNIQINKNNINNKITSKLDIIKKLNINSN